MAKFWAEIAKVVKPGGTVALWTCGQYRILNIVRARADLLLASSFARKSDRYYNVILYTDV
jgi:hypothetical protein